MEKFSVLMSVYKKENTEFFKQAMDSVLAQSVLPEEIILIRDGQVPDELQAAIDSYVIDSTLFTYIPLEENGGLGNALKIGVERARNELIARMDTDDICAPGRFELQLKFFEEHPDCAAVGGQIQEFSGSPENFLGKRIVPCEPGELKKFAKGRNPINHMTVMYKKQAVLEAGNYIELNLFEDYYLWCRMLAYGFKLMNLPEILVYARVNEATYFRRGNWQYFKKYRELEEYKYGAGLINFFGYMKNLFIRLCIQVILPPSLRKGFFNRFLRK